MMSASGSKPTNRADLTTSAVRARPERLAHDIKSPLFNLSGLRLRLNDYSLRS
jgi:hypothetical protein